MEYVSSFFGSQTALIFFICGLAFFTLGVAAMLESARHKRQKISSGLPFLGVFALLVSIVEWIDMLRLTAGPNLGVGITAAVETVRILLLAVSATYLLLFGAKLSYDPAKRKSLLPYAPPALLLIWLVVIGLNFGLRGRATISWLDTTDILTRYVLFIPANFIAAWALAAQRQPIAEDQRVASASRWYSAAAIAFGLNAFFNGLMAPPSPSLRSFLDYNVFLSALHIPVQLFTLLCAVAVTVSLVGILRIFDLAEGDLLEETGQMLTRVKHEAGEMERKLRFESEQTTREKEQQATEMRQVIEASRKVASAPDLPGLITELAQQVVALIEPVDLAAVFLYDPQKDKLVLSAAAGIIVPKLIGPTGFELAPGEGVVGKAFQTKRVLACLSSEQVLTTRATMSAHNAQLLSQASEDQPDARSNVCMPLQYQGKAYGTLLFENRTHPGAFTQSHFDTAQMLVDQVSPILANVSLRSELRQQDEERNRLLGKVISAQEDERKRIARELHDEASQALTALIIALESAEDSLPSDLKETRARLAGIKELTSQTLDEIRNIIINLRPTLLDDLGLVPALRWYAKTHLEPIGIKVSFSEEEMVERLPAQLETALFRVVQEAITNIVRHAEATRATIKLAKFEATIRVRVEDDGKGFAVDEMLYGQDSEKGLGLLGLKERVALVGGCIDIQSEPGKGTKIDVEVPLREGTQC